MFDRQKTATKSWFQNKITIRPKDYLVLVEMQSIYFGCFLAAFIISYHTVHGQLPVKKNHGTNSTQLHNGLRSSIIDGFQVISGRYFVKIGYKGSEKFCGGVFLSPIWIISAATCLQGDNRKLYFYLDNLTFCKTSSFSDVVFSIC